MPGHKGKTFIGEEAFDITEVHGADAISCPTGIIAESENSAAALFSAAKTVYSTEGCTLAIKEMLYLAVMHAKINGKKPYILAARNTHNAFISAATLLGFDFGWITGKGNILSQSITPKILEKFFTAKKKKPTAVYVTSPDYLGNILDIAGLKAVCEKHGALLLVDNAHGAYMRFSEVDTHPLSLGADMCCDSAHKTLPCLTGGAYLHINKAVYEVIGGLIDEARSLFCSTSPSWLILRSLDNLNAILADGYPSKIRSSEKQVFYLALALSLKGFKVSGDERLKITLETKSYGYYGYEIAVILRNNGIEVEFADKDFVVLMFTPEIGGEQFEKVVNVFSTIERKEIIDEIPPFMQLPERAVPLREAVFIPSEEVGAADSLGRIFASAPVSCPPAVPIIVPGEIIDGNTLDLFEYYGVNKVKVLKNKD